MQSIYDFKIKSLKPGEIDMGDYRDKYLLLVNVASECGYTPQYEDLQTIFEQYSDTIVIIGFPSNDFGGQEPGTEEEIAEFCKINYAVSFPMSKKVKVLGDGLDPVFEWLAKRSQEPSWNFCKYLVDKDGKTVKFFPSSVNPGEIIAQIT